MLSHNENFQSFSFSKLPEYTKCLQNGCNICCTCKTKSRFHVKSFFVFCVVKVKSTVRTTQSVAHVCVCVSMSQAARVRGSVGPEESVGRVLICADGLCNSRDHMTVTSRPAQRLSAPTNSLTSHPFKHKWVTLMEETRARRTHSSQADIPASDPPHPHPPYPCSRTHHSIFSVATQIRSVN